MIELGQLLQQTRIEQELSLKDVEAQTRIRQEYLQALEQGEWDHLPNPAVAKGFLRTYARFLKIESHPQVQAVFDAAPIVRERAVSSHDTAVGSYLPVEMPLHQGGRLSPRALRRALRLLLALVPVVALGFVLLKFGLPRLLNTPPTAAGTVVADATLPPEGAAPGTPVILVGASPTAATQITTLPPTFTPTPLPTATPRLTSTPTPSPTPFRELALTLKVGQRAWVRIVTDGELQLERILEPGAQQTFIAKNWVQMRTGNAAGVTLVLNGQSLGPFGEAGDVVDYVWSLQDGRISRSTPTPEPTDTPTPPQPEATTGLTTTNPLSVTNPLSDTTGLTDTTNP